MVWEVVRTETFSRMFKKYRNNAQFTQALDKKIHLLQETPLSLGGALGGHLHGYRSVRLIGKFRLIFRVDEASTIGVSCCF